MLQTYAGLGAGQEHALARCELVGRVLHHGEGLSVIQAHHDLLTGTDGMLEGVCISDYRRPWRPWLLIPCVVPSSPLCAADGEMPALAIVTPNRIDTGYRAFMTYFSARRESAQ